MFFNLFKKRELTVEEVFHKYYDIICNLIQNSIIKCDFDFELYPAMFIVADISIKEMINRDIVNERILSLFFEKFLDTDKEELFSQRTDIYCDILANHKLRCECFAGNPAIRKYLLTEDIFIVAAVLGDFLVNPECANNYNTTTYSKFKINELEDFGEIIMLPIIDTFSKFSIDIKKVAISLQR